VTPEILIAFAALLLHGGAIIGAGVWQLGKVRADVMTELTEHRREVHKLVDSDRRAVQQELADLRSKLATVELEGFQTFVRRDSFNEVMTRASAENAAYREEIMARLDRQEMKMDRLLERVHQ